MKEATGELNMTVAVVVGIAGLAAFFYFTVWPSIRNNMNRTTNCSEAICDKCSSSNCKTVSCCNKEDVDPTTKGCKTQKFECVYKG